MRIPEDRRESVKGLVKFLPYLEELTPEKVCHWITETSEDGVEKRYPTYEDTFIDFINTAYEEGLLDINYINVLQERAEPGMEIEAMIYGVDSADYELTMALLTFLVVQENLVPGVWTTAVASKLFTPIVSHLADMLEMDE
ncbi:MAG: DUF6508 domain-containing protein [Eubacteriales bacterium]|nr:DUF6508 domain-containing protein [Eubacteriales bacterium]